jgi:bifunctional non-homologous end joining protein LigD
MARALAPLPDEIVIDGEIVALDEAGKPSFNSLQNYRENHPLLYYVFDVPILSGRDLRAEPLTPALEGSLSELIEAVRGLGLEGLVAKSRDSRYEAGGVRRGAGTAIPWAGTGYLSVRESPRGE